jgi:hypothetical protein
MFMIYLHNKFYVPGSGSSSIIATKHEYQIGATEGGLPTSRITTASSEQEDE